MPTFDEFVEQFRAVKLIGDYEYVAAEPQVELARAAYDHLTGDAEQETPEGSMASPASDSAEERVPRSGELSPVGNNNTSYPHRTVVWNDHGCSGTMISRGTMLTAAHCLYNTGSNTWNTADGLSRKPYYWPAENYDSSNPQPYGSVSCSTRMVPQGWINYSSSYVSTPQSTYWDFAIVDFNGEVWTGASWVSCSDTEGDNTGWMGTWIIGSGTIPYTYSKGYPACLSSASACALGGDEWHGSPLMGTMYQGSVPAGDTKIDPNYNYILQTEIYGTNGQSGSAIYYYSNGSPMVIGTFKGKISSYSELALFRRFDATVYNWLTASSDYY